MSIGQFLVGYWYFPKKQVWQVPTIFVLPYFLVSNRCPPNKTQTHLKSTHTHSGWLTSICRRSCFFGGGRSWGNSSVSYCRMWTPSSYKWRVITSVTHLFLAIFLGAMWWNVSPTNHGKWKITILETKLTKLNSFCRSLFSTSMMGERGYYYNPENTRKREHFKRKI